MSSLDQRYRKGLRKVSATVSHVAAATPANQYLLTAGRTCVIRKLIVRNRSGANVWVDIGTGLGVAFVRSGPSFYAINGTINIWTEEEIPEVEFSANITAQVSAAAAAPADVEVTVEVEEYQGPTG